MTDLSDLPTAAFPVVFLDGGDREIPIGIVTLDSSVAFKNLQATIGQRIGVSPQQIVLHLVRHNNKKIMSIDEGSDFSAIAGERDCFVLAVLKRSRRSRGRRASYVDARSSSATPTILLRRPSAPPDHLLFNPADPDAFGSALFDTEALRDLRIHRGRYLMAAAAAATTATAAHDAYESMMVMRESYNEGGVEEGQSPLLCKVCAESVHPPPFHWCVNDQITFGFRSKVGPIERPSKAQG